MKIYMFRTVRPSIIRSLFTVHSAKVYVIQVCRQLSSRSICSCSKDAYKPVWHIPLLSVQRINSWWWTDELSETCRVSWQNKFVKLVRLVGFITKKLVTMHGHMSRCRSHVTMHGHMSRCAVTCHDARSHVTMHGHMSRCSHMLRCTVTGHDAGHMSRCTVTCNDARSQATMHGHMSRCRSYVTMHGQMNVKRTWNFISIVATNSNLATVVTLYQVDVSFCVVSYRNCPSSTAQYTCLQ